MTLHKSHAICPAEECSKSTPNSHNIDQEGDVHASRLENRIAEPQNETHVFVPITSTRPRQSSPASRPVKKVVCPMPVCSRTVLQRTLARHLRTVHGQGPLHKCETCDLRFLRKDALERHQSEQHSDSADTVECSRCGTRVVQRALKEHHSSRRCQQESSQPQVAISGRSMQHTIQASDGATALLAGASYLVEIRNYRYVTDTTVLEARQQALGSLVRASQMATIDVTMICAIWIFAIAELMQWNGTQSHQMALAKAEKGLEKRDARMFHDVLVGAFDRFERWPDAPPLPLRPACHAQKQCNLERQTLVAGAGCGFITYLAGFGTKESYREGIPRREPKPSRQPDGDAKCPLWPSGYCFDTTHVEFC